MDKRLLVSVALVVTSLLWWRTKRDEYMGAFVILAVWLVI